MAEILTLPLDLSAEGSRRLGLQLERDARAGVDLGPRQAQINCLIEALAGSLRELAEALERVAVDLPEGDPALCRLRTAGAGVTQLALAAIAGAADLQALSCPDQGAALSSAYSVLTLPGRQASGPARR